ncbi:hypothetical protein HY032_00755 [Candidatus Gottesmanbacteria bacterium]|nr:hypothetical protein [Candidatus Gottesmanbacteria bacterium]
MNKSSDINLLKAKTMLTPQLVAIEGQLRIASLVFLLVLVFTGLFFGVGYVILRKQHDSVLAHKQSLMTAIGRELPKEGLYISVKNRLAIASQILEVQRSWLGSLDLVDRVTASRGKTTFTVNENDEVSLTIVNDTLEDTFLVVKQILTEVASKTMANPVLQSVQYHKDGTVRVSLTFTPIF